MEFLFFILSLAAIILPPIILYFIIKNGIKEGIKASKKINYFKEKEKSTNIKQNELNLEQSLKKEKDLDLNLDSLKENKKLQI